MKQYDVNGYGLICGYSFRNVRFEAKSINELLKKINEYIWSNKELAKNNGGGWFIENESGKCYHFTPACKNAYRDEY